MIEYLEELLEQKEQEQTVLELAEEMLRNKSNSPREVLAIQTAIMRARATSGQYDLVIAPGKIAHQLSRELKEWDYFGVACLFLGTTYAVLEQNAAACDYLREYTLNVNNFTKSLKYQSNAWFNLGLLHIKSNHPVEASRAFDMAAKTSSVLKSDRWEHGVRQALVVQLLRSREYDRVPRLMATCSYYLRHHHEAQNKNSRLYHIQSRVRFARETGRLNRALAITVRGLAQAEDNDFHLGSLHLLMARIALDDYGMDAVIDHAVTARYYAKKTKDSSLEGEVSSFLYDGAVPKRDGIEDETIG